MNSLPNEKPRVALFVTCLVDLFRPSVGFASAKLLEDAGCEVFVPIQTCCGQPAYNSGDRILAKALARQVIDSFSSYDYIVAPSGSCAAMLAKHYPALFADDPNLSESVRGLYKGLQSFLSMRRIDARRKKASALRLRFSQSLANLRQRLSHAKLRSTTQRLGTTSNPLA